MQRRAALALLATLIAISAWGVSPWATAVHGTPGASSAGATGSSGFAPPSAGALSPAPLAVAGPHPTAYTPYITPPPALTIIYPNGSISNSSAPISQSGTTYTLTSGFIGGLQDERNGSVLVGAGYGIQTDTSLDQAILLADVNNVTVQGFVFTYEAHQLNAYDVNDLTIANDTLGPAGSYNPVMVEGATNVWFTKNTIEGTYGPYFYEATNVMVTNDNMSASYYGAYVDEVNNLLVTGSNLSESTYGVYVADTVNGTIQGNTIWDSEYGVYLDEVSHFSVSWNNASLDTEEFLEAEYATGLWSSHNHGVGDAGAIDLDGVTNFTSTSDDLVNATGDYPVYIESGINGLITGDNFSHDGIYATVYVDTYVNLSIESTNLVASYYYAIYAYGVQGFTISGDNVSGNSYYYATIYTEDCSNYLIEHNLGYDDALDVYDEDSINVSVVDNTFDHSHYGGDAVELEYEEHVWVSGNTVTFPAGTGIYLYEDQDAQVENNTVQGPSSESIEVDDSTGFVVDDNDLHNNTESALYLSSDRDFSVFGNDGSHENGTDGYGLEAEDSFNGVIASNDFAYEEYGAYLEDSQNLQFVSNEVHHESYLGTYLYYDLNTTVVANDYSDDAASFALEWNHGVTLYHNLFENDSAWYNYSSPDQVALDGGYPVGGNYWSNHTAPDTEHGPQQNQAGGDGIVDTPVVINGSIEDRYPLASPWAGYTVTFTETGLVPGTSWSVVADGSVVRSSSPTIVVEQPDAAGGASLGYSVPTVTGYGAPTPPSGSVAENHQDANVAIAFTPFNYSVTFTASGLAAGTSWTLKFGGTMISSSNATHVASAANGTYAWSAGAVSGYALTSPGGNVTVSGHAITIAVTYVATSGGSSSTGTSTNGGGYSSSVVYGLGAGLALAAIVALIALVLLFRAPRPPPAGAQAWTPPTATAPAGGSTSPPGTSPPPGATGGGPR